MLLLLHFVLGSLQPPIRRTNLVRGWRPFSPELDAAALLDAAAPLEPRAVGSSASCSDRCCFQVCLSVHSSLAVALLFSMRSLCERVQGAVLGQSAMARLEAKVGRSRPEQKMLQDKKTSPSAYRLSSMICPRQDELKLRGNLPRSQPLSSRFTHATHGKSRKTPQYVPELSFSLQGSYSE